MTHRWSLLLASLMACACASAPRVPPTLAERSAVLVLHYAIETPTAPWDGPDRLERVEACNGVAIGPQHVLTAAHCVDDAPIGATVHVVTERQHRVHTDAFTETKLTHLDTGRDIAILTVVGEPLRYHVPRRAPTADDRTVSVVRYYRAATVTSPVIGRLLTPIRHGDSGSAVVGRDGRVIGVVTSCDGDVCDARAGTGGRYTPALLP